MAGSTLIFIRVTSFLTSSKRINLCLKSLLAYFEKIDLIYCL